MLCTTCLSSVVRLTPSTLHSALVYAGIESPSAVYAVVEGRARDFVAHRLVQGYFSDHTHEYFGCGHPAYVHASVEFLSRRRGEDSARLRPSALFDQARLVIMESVSIHDWMIVALVGSLHPMTLSRDDDSMLLNDYPPKYDQPSVHYYS